MGAGDFHFEQLTLGNLAQGKLAERVEEALAEVLEVIADATKYESSIGGDVKIGLKVDLAFVHNAETGATTVGASVSVKRPNRKAVADVVFTQGGTLLVQPRFEQKELFGNVTPIAGARSADGKE